MPISACSSIYDAATTPAENYCRHYADVLAYADKGLIPACTLLSLMPACHYGDGRKQRA